MANAYATFAARGQRATTTVLREVIGPNDGLLYQFTPATQSAFDGDVADTVSYALNRVVTNGSGTAALALGRPAAAKTGTTDDNKSAWFVGYTPQLAAAVLMAKEDSSGKPISLSGTGGLSTVTGGSFPAAIWTAFMKGALEGSKVLEFPPPPAAAFAPPDCPGVRDTDQSVPAGCPSPTVVTEFTPDPNATVTLPSGTPEPPDATTSQSPDDGLFSNEPVPTPPPADFTPAPPIDEGRPE